MKSECSSILTTQSVYFEIGSHYIAQADFNLAEIPCISFPNAVITDMHHHIRQYVFITNRKLNKKKKQLVNGETLLQTSEGPGDLATYYQTELMWILEHRQL